LSLEPRPERWSGSIVALHWAGAAIILCLLAVGWAMVDGDLDSATTFDLYQWHKAFGFVALGLTALRLAARPVSPAPSEAPGWEGKLASVAQALLYILTLALILSGWLVVSASPLPVPTRFFDLFVIPNIAQPDPSLFAAAVLAHRLAAWGIALLIALHVAGALKHHFVDGDDVLTRMLPRRRASSEPRP